MIRLFFIPFAGRLGRVSQPEDILFHCRESAFLNLHGFENYFQRVSSPEACDVMIVCGGDGALLHAFHGYGHHGKPFYGLHQGNVGFLMNKQAWGGGTFSCQAFYKSLVEDIQTASSHGFYPLKAFLETPKGQKVLWAFNEVCFFRQRYKTVHFRMTLGSTKETSIPTVEQKLKKGCLSFPMAPQFSMVAQGDGILVATPLGSTAYNASAKGTVLSWTSPLLAVTPLNFYGENPWPGAAVDQNTLFCFENLSSQTRPMNVGSDVTEVEDVKAATLFVDFSRGVTLLKV